jgi:tetratricopeptide (TPR) repeat protein
MSKMKRKNNKKARRTHGPGPVLSRAQNVRLQQSVQAHTKGRLESAEAGYRALIAEKVRTAQPYFNLALICAGSDRQAEAQSLWSTALKFEPTSIQAIENLAESYFQDGKIEQAIDCCRRFVARNPHVIESKYRLANLYKARGEFDEAMELYRQVMTQQPNFTQAHSAFAGVHVYRERDDSHIAAMQKLFKRGDLAAKNRIQLSFALAKAFEDLGEYGESFQYLTTGNRLRYDMFQYTIDSDAALFQNIMQTFSPEAIAKVRADSDASRRPVFIVGMPRSGTTLVEKILSSHSDVHAAGELENLYALGVHLFMKESLNFQFAPLAEYPPQAFGELAEEYLKKVELMNDQAPRVTDKLPLNFMMIGLIRLALPQAKIIHCVRDARDTCLSIFRQNFATDNFQFAYNQKTIGQFYKLYRSLMEHWHRVFPGDIHDIRYESLTSDPEPEIRRLLTACELEWQDNCLEFHSSPGVVKTASFYQVRQPIYTSSINLWQKYEKYLQPTLIQLGGV